jgi:hypothetical protein
MATNFFKVKKGLNLDSTTAASTASAEGDVNWDATNHKIEYKDNSAVRKVVSEDGTQILTNKTLSGNTAASLISGSGTLTLNTSGTATVPNATDTLVGKATTDAFTNKTFDVDATGNSLTNIANANIKAAAGIVDTKLATISTAGKVSNSATTATSANTASAIVARDGSNNFIAGTITAALTGTASGNTTYSANNHGVVVSSGTNAMTVVAPNASTALPLISGGSSADPGWATLTEAGGGTNNTTYTKGDVLYASATNTLSKLGVGTANQVIKQVNGVPAWAAAPSGGVNYLSANPDAEVNTSGWAAYADAAGTTPVDATGGSPTTTWTRSTSSPLRGTGSFLLTKDAANRQGEGASFDFTLDSADQAKPICVSFDYTLSSGTYADGDVTVYLYDITNTTVIQPAPYKVLSVTAGVSQKWIGYFQTSAASTSYRIALHVATTSASAYTVKFDNFNVGPTYQSYGAVVTDSSSSPVFTTTNLGTTTVSLFSAREGDRLKVRGNITVGTGAASVGDITLPSGYTIDTSKMTATTKGQHVGLAFNVSNSTQNVITAAQATMILFFDGSTNNKIFFSFAETAASGLTKMNGNTVGNNTDIISLNFEVPISGWSSNVQVSSDADTRVVAFEADAQIPTGTLAGAYNIAKFGTVTKDTHAGYSTGTGLYTVPVSGYYAVSATLEISGTFAAPNYSACSIQRNASPSNQVSGALKAQASLSTIFSPGCSGVIFCNAGDTLGVYSVSGGSSLSYTNSTSGSSFCITRISGPAQIAASESVNCRYTNVAGSTLTKTANNTVPFATKDYDSHNAWATDTFTAPMAGKYSVKSTIGIASGSTWAIGDYIELDILKNGTAAASATPILFFGAFTSQFAAQISGTFNLVQGDTIKIQCYPSKASASNVTLATTVGWNNVTIERVGN